MRLTYLFCAYLDNEAGDQMVYTQTPEDTARLAPRGSAFSDVLFLQQHGWRLHTFALCRDGVALAAVHLDDGHFELGGHEFWVGGQGDAEATLVYRREVAHHRALDVDAVTLEAVGAWREWTEVRFILGWVGPDGVEHTLGLDGDDEDVRTQPD